MSIWIGLDFEATGTDPKEARPIEAAAVFYDSRQKRVIHAISAMINPGNIDDIDQRIYDLTGITKDLLSKRLYNFSHFMNTVASFAIDCPPSFWVGHNIIDYDFPMLKNACRASYHDLTKIGDNGEAISRLLLIPCIDTMVDVPYPDKIKTRKLDHLAADHGFLNLMAHSALADVMCTLRIASHYSPEELERSASSEMVLVQSNAPFEQKDEVKALGFYFEPKKKAWFKRMRLAKLKECNWNFSYSIVSKQQKETQQGDPF